jgi:hypothetical protein
MTSTAEVRAAAVLLDRRLAGLDMRTERSEEAAFRAAEDAAADLGEARALLDGRLLARGLRR